MNIGKKLYWSFGAILGTVLVLLAINLVAVQREKERIAVGVEIITQALRKNGRIIFVGAAVDRHDPGDLFGPLPNDAEPPSPAELSAQR